MKYLSLDNEVSLKQIPVYFCLIMVFIACLSLAIIWDKIGLDEYNREKFLI